MRYIRDGLVIKKYLPSDLTIHTFIFRIIWCNTAATDLILIKIKVMSRKAVDNFLDLSRLTFWTDPRCFHTQKVYIVTDSQWVYIYAMENKVMLMIDALKDGFNRFADFSGVSSRSQYWYFILGTTIATVIAQVAFGDFAGNLVSLITLLPTIAVAVRRIHDVGKSGWFILVPIYNLVLVLSPSKGPTYN